MRPYVGLGVNYTAFLWSDADDDLEAAVGRWRLMRAIAGAAQVGVDIDLEERWFVNFDVKYIDIDTSASLLIKSGALAGSSLRVDLAVDPFVVGAGIGYRF